MLKEIIEFVDNNKGIEAFLDAKIDGYFLYLDLKNLEEIKSEIIKSKNGEFTLYSINDNHLKANILNSEIQKVLYYSKIYSKGKNNNFQAFNKVKSLDSTSPYFMKIDFDYDGKDIFFYKFDKNRETEEDISKRLTIDKNINAHFSKSLEYVDDNEYKCFIRKIQDIVNPLIPTFQNSLILKKLLEDDLTNKKNLNNLRKEVLYVCIDVGLDKQYFFDNFYLKEKSFNKKISQMQFEESKCSGCGEIKKISAPFLFTNYDSTFAKKQIGINYNFKVCLECASKLIKFWELTKLSISNPLPLILYKNNKEISVFKDVFEVLDKEQRKKRYRDIIKELYFKYPRSLKNYYLFNFKFDGPQKKLFFNDVDYIENFEYMMSFKISNYLMLDNSFILDIFYKKELSVFQFERIINELIFEEKLLNEDKGTSNYFSDYKKFEINYRNSPNKNSLLKNYIIKYRQNFYDFIYKSHKTRLNDIEFREMILALITDNIRHDEINKNGYSVYENKICEKLNFLFSWSNWKNKKGNELKENMILELKNKMKKNLGYWSIEKKEFIGGVDNLEKSDDGFFFFLCGQLARYLLFISKKKEENKSHRDFYGFLEWQDSKLLKEYIEQIFAKYSHGLKYKPYNGKFENAMGIIMTYNNNLIVEDYKEYMISGYFTDNYFLADQQNEIKGESDE